jgi:hypothetical protein
VRTSAQGWIFPLRVHAIWILAVEGLHDLHLDQHLGPTREAIGGALAAGSSTLFRAFDGVRSEVSARLREREKEKEREAANDSKTSTLGNGSKSAGSDGEASKFTSSVPTDFKAALGGIGSFFGSKVASLQQAAAGARGVPTTPTKTSGLKQLTLQAGSPSSPPATTGSAAPSAPRGTWSNGK